MYSVLRTPMGESCDGKQLMHRFFLMRLGSPPYCQQPTIYSVLRMEYLLRSPP